MLPCPECAGDSRVYDTRYAADVVRRRRECLKCKHRWMTFETNIDPRQLLNMGMMIRNAFERQAKKIERASITIDEQKRLDVRAAKHDRLIRNAKIRVLYPLIPAADVSERLGTSKSTVKRVAHESGLRRYGRTQ